MCGNAEAEERAITCLVFNKKNLFNKPLHAEVTISHIHSHTHPEDKSFACINSQCICESMRQYYSTIYRL